MFIFVQRFLRRGFKTLFSYIGWQVPASYFRRLVDFTIISIALFLTLGIFF